MATGGMFIYKDIIYQQTDGVAMGNPLAPTLANFFLAIIENNIFKSTSQFYPSLYLRYVDDIFCIFRNQVDCSHFLNFLNSVHPNLHFTFEKSNTSLPFLDVNVVLKDDGCDTWVFRKKTHTNVFLNFKAVAPLKWKSGLIACMLNRAHRICSSKKLFFDEVATLKSMFVKNAYSADFFEKRLAKFLQNIENRPTPTAEDDLNYTYNLYVPFIGKPSKLFSKSVSALLSDKLGIDVNIVYSTVKVGSFFRLKSRTPETLLSRVVYKFTCLGDPSTAYVGVCSRFVIERIREHLAYWRKSPTAVGKHISKCQACQHATLSPDHFKIMKVCRNKFDAKIFEALYIKKLNPKINRQMFVNKGAGFTLRVFN